MSICLLIRATFSRKTSAMRSLSFGWLGGGAGKFRCCISMVLDTWTPFFFFAAMRPHLFFSEEAEIDVRKIRNVEHCSQAVYSVLSPFPTTLAPTPALLRETPCVLLCPHTQRKHHARGNPSAHGHGIAARPCSRGSHGLRGHGVSDAGRCVRALFGLMSRSLATRLTLKTSALKLLQGSRSVLYSSPRACVSLFRIDGRATTS